MIMQGKQTAPCFGCSHREIGCHASCASYADFKRNSAQKKRQMQNEAEADYYQMAKVSTMQQIERRKKR